MQDEAGKSTGFLRGGAQRFAEQWPYLRYLGMGVWWAWIWLCYSSTSLFEYWPDGPFAGYVGLMYLYSTPAIALMCVIAAICWRKTTPLLANAKIIVLFGLVASLGSALVAFSPWLGGDVGFAVGGILTGIGTSAISLKTGAVFGTLGRREVLTAGCVSLMLAAFLYFMGTGLPPSWRPLFVAALPFVSALLYIMPSEDPFADDVSAIGQRTSSHVRLFVCLVIAAVMVAATAGFAKGLISASESALAYDYMGSVVTFAVFCGAVVICVLVNCGNTAKMVRLCYAALILLGVVVVVLSGFGSSLAYLGIGKELLWMLLTCLMAYMVFRFDLSPVRAFGLGQAAYLLSSAAFWWFGMLMADALSGETTRIAVIAVMVVAIVLVFAFVFSDADLRYVLTWRHEDDVVASEGPVEHQVVQDAAEDLEYVAPRELTLHERIQLIDPRFGISAREAEIMELFAGGRSANWIAEELVISKNTVRSHLRSIYTKLDVHTRQELLDFLKTVNTR